MDTFAHPKTPKSPSSKKFTCNVDGCNASFVKNSALTFHIRKHTGERPYECDVEGCDKTYTNSSHLRRHKTTFHDKKLSQGLLCEHEGCGLVLANKYTLKKHYSRKHNTNRYAFTCEQCSQGFHKKKQLQQHSYLHTGEAPFKCADCEMGFTTSRGLNKHKRSHRSYFCDCGQKFERWSLLLFHRRICKRKVHQCEECKKTFTHLPNLKSHKLTHVEEAKRYVFTCAYKNCKRFYFHKKNLVHHINHFHRRIHDNNKIRCTQPGCSVILKTKQGLKQHLLRHFKLRTRKVKKARRDKGTIKKSMAEILSGVAVRDFSKNTESAETNLATDQDKQNSTSKEILSKEVPTSDPVEICLDERISDDALLKQCDVILSNLQQKCISAK